MVPLRGVLVGSRSQGAVLTPRLWSGDGKTSLDVSAVSQTAVFRAFLGREDINLDSFGIWSVLKPWQGGSRVIRRKKSFLWMKEGITPHNRDLQSRLRKNYGDG